MTNNIKIDSENKSILSYKERTKHKVVSFSNILPNNQIITACCIELRVQEMTMNKKLTMIGLTGFPLFQKFSCKKMRTLYQKVSRTKKFHFIQSSMELDPLSTNFKRI